MWLLDPVNFSLKNVVNNFSFMSGSSHMRSVLIGVEYRKCSRTLDAYLLFAIWMGQIHS